MQVDEMHQHDNPQQFTDAQIQQMWPQARGELLGFALALDRKEASITASQLRMAVQMADAHSFWLSNGATLNQTVFALKVMQSNEDGWGRTGATMERTLGLFTDRQHAEIRKQTYDTNADLRRNDVGQSWIEEVPVIDGDV